MTQTQYKQVMGTNPSHFSATGKGKDLVANLETGRHPVENVTWNEAAEFCAKLSQQEKLTPFDFRSGETMTSLEGTGYRLPTEAEWEYACRAGTTTRFWSGDEDQDLTRAGRFLSNSGGRTHSAGELKANPFGLADVHGNVWEYVLDGWDPGFHRQFQAKVATDPFRRLSADSMPISRGGCGTLSSELLRSASRLYISPPRDLWTGFRVVLVAPAVKELLGKTGVNAPPSAVAPFDEKQAHAHQRAWADHLGVPVEYTNSIGMNFRLIPPGEFLMGSTAEEIAAAHKDVGDNQSEAPQHKVILTQPIYLGVNEVTQAEYEKVMGVNPSKFALTGIVKEAVAGLETAEHPVEMVSWNDAAEFCAKLSKQEKLKPFYFRAGETITPLDGTGYRLPSEAEWEFACRAGTATKYWIGDKDEDLVRAGWIGGNSGWRTHAAGKLKANPFGLSDIHGNVWEWMQDGWDASYYGQFPDKPAINPHSPFSAGSPRVIRGGCWILPASRCRSSLRFPVDPLARYDYFGFRVSLPVDAVRQVLKLTGPAVPKPVATTPSALASEPIDFAAERRAAESVLKLGGVLALESELRQPVALVAGKLPDGLFAVRDINFLGLAAVTDADLEPLRGCRRLQSLHLKNTKINGSGLAHIAGLRTLTRLSLDGTPLTDAGLVHLQNLTQLESLYLTHTVTDQGVQVLSRLNRLREFGAIYTGRTDVIYTGITDVGIVQMLTQNPELEVLWISDGLRTLAPLAGMRRLREARISSGQLTPAGLRLLQALPELRTIISDSPKTAGDVTRLGELPQLCHVRIIYSHGGAPPYFGDEAFASLARLPLLETIRIYGQFDSPTDAALQTWTAIPTLKRISLMIDGKNRQYTSAGIAKFQALRPDVHFYADGKDYYPVSSAIP